MVGGQQKKGSESEILVRVGVSPHQVPGLERYVLKRHIGPIVAGKIQVAGDRKKAVGSQEPPHGGMG